MTPPTQAQIDAAAKIVCAVLYRPAPDMSGDIWKAVGPGMKQRCVRAAEDILIALTAAAEVEDDPTEKFEGGAMRIREFGKGATWVDFMLTKTYESKSYELAEHFLQDENPTKERLRDLACHIQQAVEDWCEQNPCA